MSSRAAEFFGANDVDAVFHGGLKAPVPWDPAPRSRTHRAANPRLVHDAVVNPDRYETRAFDPRNLYATQPEVVRVAANHYMNGNYEETGETFADKNNAGNRQPVVFHDVESGRDILQSGHHRALKALLRGEQFHALAVDGTRATNEEAAAWQHDLVRQQREARLRG